MYTTDGQSVREAINFLRDLGKNGNENAGELAREILSCFGLPSTTTTTEESAAEKLQRLLIQANEFRIADQASRRPHPSQAASSTMPAPQPPPRASGPTPGKRVDVAAHAKMRRQAEQISDEWNLKFAIDGLVGRLPPGGEIPAHADLRRIAREKLQGRALASTIETLSRKLPPGAEIAAHTDLHRIANQKLQGACLSDALRFLESRRPAAAYRASSSYGRV